MKEAKKVKEKTLAKEKVKGMFEKKTLQEAAGHNSGPPKQTYYCGSHCNFKVKKINWSSEKTKKAKNTLAREKVKGMFEKKIHLRQQLDKIVDPPRTTNTLFRLNIANEKNHKK